MKNVQSIFYALLLSGAISALCGFDSFPIREDRHSIRLEVVATFPNQSDHNSLGVESEGDELRAEQSPDGPFTAVNTVDDADATEIDLAEAPQAQIRANGTAGFSHPELMTEANRIMLELYEDGMLTKSIGYACAFADTSPEGSSSRIILEQFRTMHRKHLAQMERALTSGELDSVATRGWSDIRMDLAKLRKMTEDLRNETALAVR